MVACFGGLQSIVATAARARSGSACRRARLARAQRPQPRERALRRTPSRHVRAGTPRRGAPERDPAVRVPLEVGVDRRTHDRQRPLAVDPRRWRRLPGSRDVHEDAVPLQPRECVPGRQLIRRIGVGRRGRPTLGLDAARAPRRRQPCAADTPRAPFRQPRGWRDARADEDQRPGNRQDRRHGSAAIRFAQRTRSRPWRKTTRVTNAAAIRIRPAEERDRLPLAELFAAVAEERDGIATEPPVDIEARAASWRLDGSLVAVDGERDRRVALHRHGRSRLRRDRHDGCS